VLENKNFWTIGLDQTIECFTDTGKAMPSWQMSKRQDARVNEMNSSENGVPEFTGAGIDGENGGARSGHGRSV